MDKQAIVELSEKIGRNTAHSNVTVRIILETAGFFDLLEAAEEVIKECAPGYFVCQKCEKRLACSWKKLDIAIAKVKGGEGGLCKQNISI